MEATQIETPAARSFVLMGRFAVPFGFVLILSGVVLLSRWHREHVNLLESRRGERIEMALDLSNEGLYSREIQVTGRMPHHSVNLCFCESYEPDSPPPVDVLDRLRFDVRVRERDGPILASSEYRRYLPVDPIRGMELLDLSEVRNAFGENPIVIEMDVIEPVHELENVPAAIYLGRSPRELEGCKAAAGVGFFFFLCPGVLLLAFGALQIVVSVGFRPQSKESAATVSEDSGGNR